MAYVIQLVAFKEEKNGSPPKSLGCLSGGNIFCDFTDLSSSENESCSYQNNLKRAL